MIFLSHANGIINLDHIVRIDADMPQSERWVLDAQTTAGEWVQLKGEYPSREEALEALQTFIDALSLSSV